jgi:hypothetical protein
MDINNLVSFRQSKKNNLNEYDSDMDDDKIITATITFDLTVDQSTGRVLNATEGQVISETHISPIDGINLCDYVDHHKPCSTRRYNSSLIRDEDISKSDSVSTTTKSLIDKTKKYVKGDDGIIILKKDRSSVSSLTDNQNLSIKLDFDVADDNSDKSSLDQFNMDDKSLMFQSPKKDKKLYNINLDLDLDNKIISKVSSNKTYVKNNNIRDLNDFEISITKTKTLLNENFEIGNESIDENLQEETIINNGDSFNKSRSSSFSQSKLSNKTVAFKDVEEFTITPLNSSSSSSTNENEKNNVNLIKSQLRLVLNDSTIIYIYFFYHINQNKVKRSMNSLIIL